MVFNSPSKNSPILYFLSCQCCSQGLISCLVIIDSSLVTQIIQYHTYRYLHFINLYSWFILSPLTSQLFLANIYSLRMHIFIFDSCFLCVTAQFLSCRLFLGSLSCVVIIYFVINFFPFNIFIICIIFQVDHSNQ